MARKKHSYRYHDAKFVQIGMDTMICDTCHKPITEGQFREREKEDRHVLHHRACSQDDPFWGKEDKRRQKAYDRHRQFASECREFKARWGIDDLDHYIGEDQ